MGLWKGNYKSRDYKSKGGIMRRLNIAVFWIFCCILIYVAGCEKRITEAYEYPVVPGMEEWKKLKSLPEMAEACQIPEDILDSMTTEALMQFSEFILNDLKETVN